jgi:hypothetical protein
MRRTTIALLAALEATVSTLIGYGIALVPLMLLWAIAFGLAAPLEVLVYGITAAFGLEYMVASWGGLWQRG